MSKVGNSLWISPTGNNHVQDLKDSIIRLVLADTDEEKNHAYEAFKMREREMYEYIEILEATVGIKQPIIRRF